MYIYLIQNKLDGKCYVGQTIGNVKYRWSEHKCMSAKKCKSYLRNAIRKHGEDAFTVTTIDTARSTDELNERERYWIETLRACVPHGYNIEIGGKSGPIVSDASKRNMSEAQKLRFQDPAQRANSREYARRGRERIVALYTGVKRPHLRMKISLSLGAKPFHVFKKDGTYVGEWVNQRICSDDLKVPYQNLNKALKGLRITASGYKFKYV